MSFYALVVGVFALGLLLGSAYRVLSLPSWSLPSTDVLPAVALIIDLGILLLIVYADMLRPFFLRPRPVIDYAVEGQVKLSKSSQDTAIFEDGKTVELAGVPCTSLWLTVTNDGKSSIKHLRARASVLIKKFGGASPETKPEYLRHVGKSIEIPFPFLKRGTLPMPWRELHRGISHDIDLAASNDTAGLPLIRVCLFNEPDLRSRIERVFPPVPERVKNIDPLIILVGEQPMLFFYGGPEDPMIVFLVRFWIIGENLERDYQKLFRVEVPRSLQTISCTPITKSDTDYKSVRQELSE